MKKFKVGVIGNGFVGEAISFAFSPVADLYVYDTDPLKSLDDLESVHSCDFVFICVPTPMFQDGSQDLSYVESTFEKAHPNEFFAAFAGTPHLKRVLKEYPPSTLFFGGTPHL